MKTVILILAAITAILWLSTAICGLWIRYSGQVPPEELNSSLNFHLGIAVLSVVFTAVTMILSVSEVYKLSA